MDFFASNTKRATPSELGVIAVCASGLLILLGSIGLGLSLSAAPENSEAAAELARYAWWSIGIGVFIGFAFWIARRVTR